MVTGGATGAFRVCGVRIDGLTLKSAARRILDEAAAGGSVAVHLCNAYVLATARRDPAYAALLNRGDLNLPDGAPVAAVGRALGFSSLTGRASGPDLMLETIRLGVAGGTRHYLYGGSPAVVDQLEARLHQLAPGAEIVGVESPPFREVTDDEIDELVERIEASGADIVWVGLGTPKQNLMVDRLHGRVDAVIVPVGAAFDFIAGAKARAPAWMQRANLEWLFRLGSEPRRLLGRYLWGNLSFLRGALKDRALVASAPTSDSSEDELNPRVLREIISPTRWRSRLGRVLLLLDTLVIGVSSLLAYLLRDAIGGSGSVGPLEVEAAIPVLVLPAWLAILNMFGCHAPQYQNQGGEAFRRFVGASLAAVTLLGFASYLFDLEVSRLYLGFLFSTVLAFGTISRAVVRHQLARARRSDRLLQHVVVVGTDAEAQQVATAMHLDPSVGYRVVGFVDDDRAIGDSVTEDLRVLGRTSEVLDVALTHGAGLAVISPTAVPAGTLRDVTLALEGSPVDLAVAPSLFEVVTRRVAVESVGNVALLHVQQMRLVGWRALAKFTLDIVGAGVLFILMSPVLLLAALAIRLQRDGGPILFRQTRVGRDGHTFSILKFRTMVPDAEERIDELAELNEAGHVFFKIRKDPRVTRVGAFLRRWSIDELPQLLNVLQGNMSLVGPRPPIPEEVEQYEPWHLRRLRIKPGVTGVWQTSGRSNVPFDEAVRMDLFYIENWSLGYDLFLLAKTVTAVLGRHGAY